jgi:integrase/recombinase XerC
VNQLVPITSAALPTLAATTGEQASIRFLEFFAVNIRNPHKRQALCPVRG